MSELCLYLNIVLWSVSRKFNIRRLRTRFQIAEGSRPLLDTHEVRRVAVFDMFPATGHVEMAVYLRRRGSEIRELSSRRQERVETEEAVGLEAETRSRICVAVSLVALILPCFIGSCTVASDQQSTLSA